MYIDMGLFHWNGRHTVGTGAAYYHMGIYKYNDIINYAFILDFLVSVNEVLLGI